MVLFRDETMIRIRPNTFVRHAGDESVVWCSRMCGCTVLRNLSESIPISVTCTNQHSAVHDGEDMNLVVGMFIDDAIWTALSLAEAVIIKGKSPETFFRYHVTEFWKRREQSRGLPKVSVPSAGNLSRLLTEYEPNNAHTLGMGVPGPLDPHRRTAFVSISSSIRSASAKASSSVMNSPFSNSLREISMDLDSSARLRHVSISSHVLSKSATLIITLVLRPFCVMTMGRCVRAVRAKQSLRVRRYSVKGTTSSSRRGRSIVLVFVRMVFSLFESTNMVHYFVPIVNRAFSFQECLEAA